MRKYIILAACAVATSCASIQNPEISIFTYSSKPGEKEDTVTVTWSTKNAESVKLNVDGIEEEVTPYGEKKIFLTKDSKISLKAESIKGSEKQINQILNVKKVLTPQEKPKEKPIEEKRNLGESTYITGYVNAKEGDSYSIKINSIDLSRYPDNVTLYVSVIDAYGNHIANLAPPYNYTKEDFWKSVAETREGKKYKITDFKVQEYRQSDSPDKSSSFVLDYSGSMFADYISLQNAFLNATTYLREGKDDFSVVQFDHRVKETIKLAEKRRITLSNLEPMLYLGGGTAFYSASIAGISSLGATSKEKIAVLFTDGFDNSSLFSTANDVINKARSSNTRVFVIGFTSNGLGSVSLLKGIAEQTGGKAYFPTSNQDFDMIFKEIFNILNVYYKISYTTVGLQDSVRNIEVSIQSGNQTSSDNKNYYIIPSTLQEARRMVVSSYKSNQINIDSSFSPQIDILVKYLKDNTQKKILITAHADMKGESSMNMALSKRRALRLQSDLLKRGILKSQIQQVLWKGESQPIHNPELTDWQRMENRRVEIEIID